MSPLLLPLLLVLAPEASADAPARSTAPRPSTGGAAGPDGTAGPADATAEDPSAVEPPSPSEAPMPSEPAAVPPSIGLSDGYEPPFPSEPLELSQVLTDAAATNLDLVLGQTDIEIAETQIMAAVGAYDVILTAGLNASFSESPQRGSQFAFALGSRAAGANVGFQRALETGGQVSLSLTVDRTLTDQPVNFFDATQGATTLSSYRIAPTLTISHPLLRGAGLEVNMANRDKAQIAVTQAEAGRQLTAQNLARDIISAYWDVLFAHRDLDNKRRSVEQVQRQLERTEALVSAGRLSPVDIKAVEQAIAQREADVLVSENNLLDASLNLRTLLGQDFADRDLLGVMPATDPVVVPRPIDIKDEIDRALQANPQIRQLELSRASLRIDEMVAANARLPQLDFQGSISPQGRSVDSFPDASTGDPGSTGGWAEAFRNIFSEDVGQDGVLADWTVSGQLTLTWDVQNRTPKAQHQAAKLQMRRNQEQLQQVRQQISAGVIRAASSLRTAGKSIEVAEVSLELAQENLEAEQARFDVGRSTNFDVLQRLDEIDTAAASALSAQINYLKALAQLQALNGEILPAYGLAE
ncbi:MAG: TolC family protein [Nannocystaceae bacterium]|nr:TolC family protein [bacterium]